MLQAPSSQVLHFKVSNEDSRNYVYDKTYKKEKTEKIYDEGNNGGNFLFKCLTIILSLGMIFSVGVFITEHCQSGFQKWLQNTITTNS